MHNNYYFLRQLSHRLEGRLLGTVVSECFSQNKNELIIRFEGGPGTFIIKASLYPNLCCLSFPEEFNRARKNSIDLFGPLIGKNVLSIHQHTNERSFSIAFTELWTLCFKMHGNKSNLILLQDGSVRDLFRKKVRGDLSLKLDTLDRTIDWSYEHVKDSQEQLQKVYFTFGKVIWRHLEENGFYQKTIPQKWEFIQHLRKMLDNPTYSIAEVNEMPVLTLVPIDRIIETYNDPIVALNNFFYRFTNTFAFTSEKTAAVSDLQARITNNIKYLEKVTGKLNRIKKDNHFKMWADLIMANLHTLQPGLSTITLPDLYNDNQLVSIKMKGNLSPQKNAEILYQKAKNHDIEVGHLQRLINEKDRETVELKKSCNPSTRLLT